MRIKKPVKHPKRSTAARARDQLSQPGMRWLPSRALSPANLLMLQQNGGNQAVINLLKRHIDPVTGQMHTLKTYQAARRDGIAPVTGMDAEPVMGAIGPQYGDWSFHFIADTVTGAGAMICVTLERFRNRQRHILFDADTRELLDVVGHDLDERTRQLLADWATHLLNEQLTGQPVPSAPAENEAASPREEEELQPFGLLFDDGDDENR